MSLEAISSLQHQLQNRLGPNYGTYLATIRDWFGQRITKDFFDEMMAKLFKAGGGLAIHNEMMRLIIFLCSSTPTTTRSTASNNITVSTDSIINSYSINDQQYNSPIVFDHISIDGSQQEPEYITVNFVENEETMQYENETDEQVDDFQQNIPPDWLYNVNLVTSSLEDAKEIPFCLSNEKFPIKFSNNYQTLKVLPDASKDPDTVINVTHGYDITDRLNKNTNLKQHFKIPLRDNQPCLTTDATIYGRFLLKAWESGLDGVDPQVINVLLEEVRKHIRIVVTSVIKQRRSFRMRDKQLHSIGVPYPNPYLRQGHQLFDDPYSSDSTKLADVMQVPTMLPPSDEKERIASLQLAASIPQKDFRFSASKASLADFLNVIENDPAIIPQNHSRLKLLAMIKQNYKGYGGSVLNDMDEDDDTQGLLPICSY